MSRNHRKKYISLTVGTVILVVIISLLIFKTNEKKVSNTVKVNNTANIEERVIVSEVEKPNEKTQENLSKVIGYKKALETIDLRKSKSIEAEVLYVIPKEEYVEYYGSLGDWDKIEYSGIEGYCDNQYLELNEDENIFKVIDGILIVNRKYGLPEDFNPGLGKNTETAFLDMKTDAKKENIIINIASGFRDYKYQEEIFNNCVEIDGVEKALLYITKPGYSEHQTGLSIDIMGPSKETRINSKFDNTKEALWLEKNAYKYGFILRYPKGKEDITGIKYESWHYRYVGKDTAEIIQKSGETLEEYLNIN